MKTDNELIAEFMGLPLTKMQPEFSEGRKLKEVPFMNWKYHISWDWLMPVIEKCYQHPNAILTKIDDAYNDFSVIDRIGPVHKAVVEFIKLHNQQPTQQ